MDEWPDASTAPKDGTPILGYFPGNKRRPVREVSYARDYETHEGYWTTPHGPSGRGYALLPESLTHWMPLPDPPRQAKEASNE